MKRNRESLDSDNDEARRHKNRKSTPEMGFTERSLLQRAEKGVVDLAQGSEGQSLASNVPSSSGHVAPLRSSPKLPKKMRKKEEYAIGWVCPLEKEARPALLLLDERHETHIIPHDPNSYTFGRMGVHNVVIATLPSGIYGIASAAGTVGHMRRSFPMLKSILLVGIGAGIPSRKNDIRLGDVVISRPNHDCGGVVQFDLGTEHADGSFRRKGFMNKPSDILLSTLNSFQAGLDEGRICLSTIMRNAHMEAALKEDKYRYPGKGKDHLFPRNYPCAGDGKSCENCDKSYVARRRQRGRMTSDPVVHCGIVASGNKLVRNPKLRDKLYKKYEALCIEMEAAGVMNILPALVIRGVCDYADSHKNDVWHDYAALTAAACAKALLSHLNPISLLGVPGLEEAWDDYHRDHPDIYTRDDEVHIIEKDEYMKKIFPNISPFASSKRHHYYLDKTLDGTWNSIVNHPVFLEWKAPKTSASVLCCFGEPGVGKSCMIARIIELLEHDQINGNRGTGLAYMYCKYDDLEEMTDDMVAKLASQLLLQASISRTSIEALCNQRLSLDEILSSICKNFERVYFCLDGMDEIDGGQRAALLAKLLKAHENPHVILTARAHIKASLLRQLPRSKELSVMADRNDIISHVRYRVLSCDMGWSDLADDVTKKILDLSKGNFLFADSLISIILDGDTVREIRDRMRRLPETLEAAYSSMIQRIQTTSRAEQANRILRWTALSERPLKLSELRLALAVDGQPSVAISLAEEDLITQSVLESACQGLIFIDASDQTVRLFHLSFQKYLRADPLVDSTRKALTDNAQERIAQACLRYLMLPEITDFSCESAKSIHSCSPKDLVGPLGLLDYASSFWGCHMRKSGQTDEVLVIAKTYILSDLSQRYAGQWFLCQSISRRYQPQELKSLVFSFSRVHQAAYFGLDTLLDILFRESDSDINLGDCSGATPLHWAAGQGHPQVVKFLLDKNADVLLREAESVGGGTALTRALDWELLAMETTTSHDAEAVKESAREDTVRIIGHLLNRGAMINYFYCVRETEVLDVSRIPGHRKMIRDELLSAEGGVRTSFTFIVQTPLARAARVGNVRVIEQLLEKGADVNAQTGPAKTALYWAVSEERESVVSLLLDRGIATGFENGSLSTVRKPLRDRPANEIMRILSARFFPKNRPARLSEFYHPRSGPQILRLGIFRDPKFVAGKLPPANPLRGAILSGETNWARSALRKRWTTDEDSHDPVVLTSAAQTGDTRIMRILLGRGVDSEAKDDKGRNSMSWAAQRGDIQASRLLIGNGAHVDSVDPGGYTPLMWAVIARKRSMVEYLLRKGASVTARDKKGHTALTWAAAVGDTDLISILLENDAVLDHKSGNKCTPLMWAAAWGHHEALCQLLDRNADLRRRDRNGHTALFWAAKGGHLDIIRELRQRGLALDDKDKHGRTSLDWAAGRGHEKVVQYLLRNGGDITSSDKSNVTALSWAAAGGHTRVLKYLLSKGASPDSADTNGWTALSYSVQGAGLISVYVKDTVGYGDAQDPTVPRWMTFDDDSRALRDQMTLLSSPGNGLILAYSSNLNGPKVVSTLLKSNADIESRSKEGQTALSLAAKLGKETMIQTLLEHGASTKSRDNTGRMPLSWAAGSENGYQGLKMLLSVSPKRHIDTRDKGGRTPLSWAAGAGNSRSVRALLEMGADPLKRDHTGRTPLSWAIQSGVRKTVKILLMKGTYPSSEDASGRSLLSYASQAGEDKTFQELIQCQSSELDRPDKSGRTPLSWAGGGEFSRQEIRCPPGSDPAKENRLFSFLRGEPPGNGQVARRLIEKGANTEYSDLDGKTPLMWAISQGHILIVRTLLEEGADIEARDNDNQTPLFYAIKHQFWLFTKLLLDAGADPDHQDNKGWNAFGWAALQQNTLFYSMLAFYSHAKGWNVNILSSTRTTVIFHVVCTQCRRKIKNKSFYGCDSCLADEKQFILCIYCFDAGISCPNMHEIRKCRINEPD